MSLRACALALLLLSPLGYLKGGSIGWLATLLGIGATSLNLWAWYVLIGFLGRNAQEDTRGGTFLVGLAFLTKAPVFIGLYFSVHSWGENALACSVLGIVLVYFALVGWALGKSRPLPRDSNGRPN